MSRELDPQSKAIWADLRQANGGKLPHDCCRVVIAGIRKGFNVVTFTIGIEIFDLKMVFCPECGRKLQ